MANKSLESSALTLSAAGYATMAVAGLVFAVLTGSGAILFDGAYSLISLLMTFLARKVAMLVEQPDSESFHFGYAYFEPLLNTVRGLLILVVVLFAVGTAVLALFSGGRPLKPGLALTYSIIVALICFVLSVTQRRNARRCASPLLEVDARNWLIDGGLTVAVGLTFLFALFLQSTTWAAWVPYVDPAVVIVLGLVMVGTPVVIVLSNAGELLHLAPDPGIQADIRPRFEQATSGLSLRRREVRMVKVGRYFYVLAQLIVAEDFRCAAIGELDRIRAKIAGALAGCHPRLLLDVVFSADERWVLGLVADEPLTSEVTMANRATNDTDHTDKKSNV